MNIPAEVARAQGPHGVKGAVHGPKGAAHGIKGGRPRLDLNETERKARRALQSLICRKRKAKRLAKLAKAGLAGASWLPLAGRNEPCPCGSGRKYKKCCMP